MSLRVVSNPDSESWLVLHTKRDKLKIVFLTFEVMDRILSCYDPFSGEPSLTTPGIKLTIICAFKPRFLHIEGGPSLAKSMAMGLCIPPPWVSAFQDPLKLSPLNVSSEVLLVAGNGWGRRQQERGKKVSTRKGKRDREFEWSFNDESELATWPILARLFFFLQFFPYTF